MGYPVFDHASDNLCHSWVCIDISSDDPLSHDEGDAFDLRAAAFDVDAVLTQIRAHYARQQQAKADHGYWADEGYYIGPKGQWHCNPVQGYLCADDEPFLGPEEWLDQSIALFTTRETRWAAARAEQQAQWDAEFAAADED